VALILERRKAAERFIAWFREQVVLLSRERCVCRPNLNTVTASWT
jgi:hypothetical protein